jgi:hypothetical protein
MTTTTQISRPAPWMEDYIKSLYADAQAQVAKDVGQFPPAYQIAGLSPLETQAAGVLQGGIGSWAPYLQEAQGGVRAGMGAIGEAGIPMMQQGYGTIGQAQQLAGMTRGIPYQYRDQAMGQFGQAQDLATATRGTPYQYRDQGIGALQGAMGGFDPSATYDSGGNLVKQSAIMDYYDPYAEDVIAAQQADIERLGKQQRLASSAQAAAAGAFGGSRGAVEQAEIGRNVLGEQSRMGAQLRSQGYQQARQAAMQAFEAQKARQMAAGQGIGQLGLQYGQLGQQDVAQQAALAQARGQMGLQYGQLGQQDVAQLAALGQARGQLGQGIGALGTSLGALGMQQAQLGEGAQRMNMADVNAMMQLGGTYRTQQQAELEALRRSQAQAQMYPYQQMAYLADLFKTNPSGTYSMLTEPTAPAPSPFQQAAGLGIAGLGALGGAKYAGLF